jgi:phosphotransferase system HPr (HPr) family protein
MKTASEELSRNIVITNELGLHARPAAMIAKLAQKAQTNIWIVKNGAKVDAASIIDILSLGCVKGTELTFLTEHKNDVGVIDEIIGLIKNGAGD